MGANFCYSFSGFGGWGAWLEQGKERARFGCAIRRRILDSLGRYKKGGEEIARERWRRGAQPARNAMSWRFAVDAVLFVAAIPFVYYLLAIYSTLRFFGDAAKPAASDGEFTPAVSNLKPVKGLDPEAYENFASFCRQDYPEYELLFCVDADDPAVPVLEQLRRDFPECKIRLLFGAGRVAPNDKVARLSRLVEEARHEVLVINDSDVRVAPDYFRTVVGPLRDAKVGGVTCLYVAARDANLTQSLQSIGMLCDFYPGIFVARELDGIKFALGPTIVTTRARLASFGGYRRIENGPADDLLIGRLIAEQGCEMVLLPYAVETVPDFGSLRDLGVKRARWMTVMRHMRPWGHLGLVFTQGLPWAAIAVAARPEAATAIGYFGGYLAVRVALTWLIGGWGLKQRGLWKKMPLIVVWDAFALVIWLGSFARRTIRWRGVDYRIRDGKFVSATPRRAAK
jgi:ceramide glucosyltransferase